MDYLLANPYKSVFHEEVLKSIKTSGAVTFIVDEKEDIKKSFR